jgi:Mg2+ and Co2+ transporter CorA
MKKVFNPLYYENCILKNSNFALICSIKTLEKRYLEKTNEVLDWIKKYNEFKNNYPRVIDISGIIPCVCHDPETLEKISKKEEELVQLRKNIVDMQHVIKMQNDSVKMRIADIENDELKLNSQSIDDSDMEKIKLENQQLQDINKTLQEELNTIKSQTHLHINKINQLQRINEQITNERNQILSEKDNLQSDLKKYHTKIVFT